MIRVLQYIGSLEQGGSQSMIMNIYRNIDRDKVQFDFVIHSGGITPLAQEAEKLGATIYQCPQYTTRTASKYSNWWKHFFRDHKEYKIIHSHVRSTAAIVLRIAKRAGCVTIAHSHSTSTGGGIRGMVKSVLQFRIRYVADHFMGCSQKAGEWLFGEKVCSSNRYHNVPNAIDAEKYVYNSAIAQQVRTVLGYTDDNFVIGHVGRYTPQKNHMFLLDVFKKIHEQDPKYKLLLVGDGELWDQVKSKIQEYHLEDCITMTGNRNDVNELMMAMDLFLFPSNWEGLGMVLIEAQATCCPCIASDVVPEEAKITDLVEFLPLHETAEFWAEKVNHAQRVERKNMSEDIRRNGYDVAETAVWMQNFYLKCVEEK